MLRRLLSAIPNKEYQSFVVSLTDSGPIGKSIEMLDVPIFTLEMSSKRVNLNAFRSLRTIVTDTAPDLIQGWMYHGNLMALIASFFSKGETPVIWNIRHSIGDLGREKFLTRQVIRLGARLSKRPKKIIYNATVSALQHEALGYECGGRVIIPNGVDLTRFSPNEGTRAKVRQRLGYESNSIVIGLLARSHPMKAHKSFIRAAGAISREFHNTQFLMAGRGIDAENKELMRRIKSEKIEDRVRLLGEQSEVPEILAALDIVTLTSEWGEGFPNIIAEAMACERPCVVTDVGDSGFLVGNTGLLVPPNDIDAFVRALRTLISEDRVKRNLRGKNARSRISQNFSLGQVAMRYQNLYGEVLANG